MATIHAATCAALRANAAHQHAAVKEALKARADLVADQIDAAAPASIDVSTDETGDELVSSSDSSREGTPAGSGGSSCAPSGLSRVCTDARQPICGNWGQARTMLSSNVGRMIVCIGNFANAVADLPQQQAAVQQQLANWHSDLFMPLLLGFTNSSLAFSDDDVQAVCGVVQRLLNAYTALLALDPPAEPRSWAEMAIQVLIYVFFCEYLHREGVYLRSNGPSSPRAAENAFAVGATGQELLVLLCYCCMHCACT